VAKFEVVFETSVYYSVFVDADNAQDASDKALEQEFPPPSLHVPNGFEVSEDWFVEGVVRAGDDD